MKKRAQRGIGILLLLAALLSMGSLTAAAEPAEESKSYPVDTQSEVYAACQEIAQQIDASQVLVYDATHDEMLFTKTVPGGKLYPASITKLFSAYVALQILAPDDTVTAGDELSLVQEGSSMAYIYRGQTVTVEMAVEAMLLPSGNDAAMILAAAAGRRIAPSRELLSQEAVDVFVAEMNRQAAALGFEQSHFANPDGYHAGCHYTCVNDLARIAKLALEDPTISRFMQVFEADVTYASGQTNHWKNTNALLNPEAEFYRADAIGMKTGHTSQAGHCLMAAFRTEQRTLVVGIFGCSDILERFRAAGQLADACK